MADQQDGAEQSRGEDGKGGDPGHQVEAVSGGRGQHHGAVFGDEGVQNLLVGRSRRRCRRSIRRQLAFRVGAADVVALAQDLGAAAGAHQAVIEIGEAGAGIGGAEGEADGHGEGQGLRRLKPEGGSDLSESTADPSLRSG